MTFLEMAPFSLGGGGGHFFSVEMKTVPIFKAEEKMKGEKYDNILHGVMSQMRYCS
jgi:hypothetical protein